MTLEKIFSFFAGSGAEGDMTLAEFADGIRKLNSDKFNLTDVSRQQPTPPHPTPPHPTLAG
jgi:hypothetical protein